MKYSRPGTVFLSILFAAFVLVASGCGGQNVNVQELLNRPIEATGHFHQSKKYIKHGITVVYLTGTPYDIGFAHGKLCKDEIRDVNQYYWEAYGKLKNTPDGKWLLL
jgi:hypothetical protein